MALDTVNPKAQGQYVTANGLRIYYEERGAGHPLVLLQQGFDTHHVWDSQLATWEPHFRVFSADGRGLGRTRSIRVGRSAMSCWGGMCLRS
jgi:pimeloyl-ACP methyl ester carboxylesterase